MIILGVNEFVNKSRSQTLVHNVEASVRASGRAVTDYELRSWSNSWPKLAEALSRRLSNLKSHQIALEVEMPGSGKCADAVLLGRDGNLRRAIVVEFKQWDRAIGVFPDLIAFSENSGREQHRLHPCAQASSYANWLKHFSSAFSTDEKAEVLACAFLHELADATRLGEGGNAELVNMVPVLAKAGSDQFAQWLVKHIPGPATPEDVESLRNQTRYAGRSLAESLEGMATQKQFPWILLDEQREAMARMMKVMTKAAEDKKENRKSRHVVIVTGPPGSGKTILAIQALVQGARECGLTNMVFATTSDSQTKTIEQEINHIAKAWEIGKANKRGGVDGLVIKAGTGILKLKGVADVVSKKDFDGASEQWPEYLRSWRRRLLDPASKGPILDLVVCDEAQGLLYPTKPYVAGAKGPTWQSALGPQAAHLIYSASVCVFFADAEQGYRQAESTTPDDIAEIATLGDMPEESRDAWESAVGRATVERISVDGLQFRCGGSPIFMDWVDAVLGFGPPPANIDVEQNAHQPGSLADILTIWDDPKLLLADLRVRHRNKQNVRLVAGYAWDWLSQKDPARIDSVDGLGRGGQFNPLRSAPFPFRWPRYEDASNYNLGTNGYDKEELLFGKCDPIGNDPQGTHCQMTVPATAGYPLTVRGRDFDHVGVLWGADLVWRDNAWRVDVAYVFGSDNLSLKTAIANGEEGAADLLATAQAQAYRILLTRGMQSVSLWIEDEETRNHVRESWKSLIAPRSHKDGVNSETA